MMFKDLQALAEFDSHHVKFFLPITSAQNENDPPSRNVVSNNDLFGKTHWIVHWQQ